MPRSTRTTLTLAADAITVEGALIPPAMLARVASQQADGQSEEDYRVPKGLTLRDEIARYFRIGQALFTDLHASPLPSAGKTVAFVEALLRDVFGFADLVRVSTPTLGGQGQLFAPTFEGLGGRVPIVVVPPNDELDHTSEHLTFDHRRRSAASALQDWLNANEKALWGISCNGDRLRLVRDNASLTRPSYIEADLRHIFDNETFADFTTLWLLVHSSRFGAPGAVSSDSYLEHWREAGQREGVTARDRLRDGVEAALLALGTGFLAHEKNSDLRERVRTGTLPLPEFFGQLLRLVYRLIFLLTAEDRELLHMPVASAQARKLYTDGYSLGLLRDRAVRRAAWDRHHDRWEGLLITFSALSRGEPRLGLPALDGLFATGSTSDLEAAHLSNRALMEGIYRLAWLRESSGLFQVNWRDMETEELGSVYESLLELTPRLTNDGHALGFAEGSETKGHARKTTGSYYTPDALVQALLNTALDPVLDRAEAEANDPAQALLGVTIIDPACGSGHFLLAAARRIATRLAKTRTGGVASAGDFRHALRDVVRSCIHGVDRNPMAVELTKVALWIETVEPGKPLGFLDSSIRCGDSLLGVFDLEMLRKGIPDAAYRSLTGDDRETAKHFERRNKAEREGQGSLDFVGGGGTLPPLAPIANDARALRALPEESLEELAAKRARFRAERSSSRQQALRVAADLYLAAFLAPKIGDVVENRDTIMVPTTAHVWASISGQIPMSAVVAKAQDSAVAARAFHWPLEFSHVMIPGRFDVVLGNPPWEVMQLGEEEYFAQRLPEIAELVGAARKRAIADLELERPTFFATYQMDKRRFEASNEFARVSGRFHLTARGKINTYALFAELFKDLTRSDGRAGVILPTGIATDATNAEYFGALIEEHRLVRLISFENEDRIFLTVHHSFRFCLMTLGRTEEKPEFAFFLRNVGQLDSPERLFDLSPEELASVNPRTKTAPIFRTQSDALLTAQVYGRVATFGDPAAGESKVDLIQNFFSTSNRTDMESFSTAVSLPHGDTFPVLRGKMIDQFDHRAATFDVQRRDFRELSPSERTSATFEPISDKTVSRQDLLARLSERRWSHKWLMGWRDISSAHVLRTVICAAFPISATDDTLSLILPEKGAERAAQLLANMNSLILDYIARQKVGGTHIRKYVIQQLPILRASAYTSADCDFIFPRVVELSYTSYSMAPFAHDLGYSGPPFAWNENRRCFLRAELDAWYARAYGLTRDELRYVLDPADVKGPDYPSETFRVLKKNEIARFGEYRTAQLVLAAWDQLQRIEVSDVPPPIPIAENAIASSSIDVSKLPDGAWVNPTPSADAGLAQIAALVKALPGPTLITQVRLAAILVLEPRYLSRRLPQRERRTWSRLVGPAADLVTDPKVITFTSGLSAGWRNAVTQLLGMRAIIEDSAAHTWAAGPGLNQFVVDDEAWPYGRATFVLQALSKINLDEAVADLSHDDQAWVRASAA